MKQQAKQLCVCVCLSFRDNHNNHYVIKPYLLDQLLLMIVTMYY